MSAATSHSARPAAFVWPAEGSWARAGVLLSLGWVLILALFWRDTADLADPRFPPKVRLTGYSPYGINVEVCAYAKPESLLPDMINAVARSIANADFLENRAINKES